MSQEFLDEILSSVSPMAKSMVSMMAPNITSNPTFVAVAGMVQKLAENDGLSVSTFLQSGRAIQVLQSLAAGQGQPDKPDIEIMKCPKCNHVHYGVIHG